jgi:hypothetical protein
MNSPPPIKKKKSGTAGTIFIIVVMILIIYSVGSYITSGQAEELAKEGITLAEYNTVADGMTYEMVCTIIGSQGVESASNFMEGVPGVMESVKTVMYSWQNENGSNMTATFQNGNMVMKAQFGLE